MKPICIIPARAGSKGIPKKNIRTMGDKPLIAHTIESALNSRLFDHVVVSTEDCKIANISKQYGAEIPLMRPKKLATDIATTDAVLIHAINELYSLGYKFEILCMRDCTVPFIDKADMKGAIDLLIKSLGCESVFTVCRAHPNPYFDMFELTNSGYMRPSKTTGKPFTRRQDAPIVYSINGFYVHYAKKLLQAGKMFTARTLPYEISKEHGYMIDYEIDFKIAEIMYKLKKRSHGS